MSETPPVPETPQPIQPPAGYPGAAPAGYPAQPAGYPGAAPVPAAAYGQAPASTGTPGLAIAGLILAFVAPLIGLILSLVARSKVKKTGSSGKGLTLAGIIVGALGTLAGVIWIVAIIFLVAKTPTVDTGALERDIVSQYSDAGYTVTADCPNFKGTKGSTFQCDVTEAESGITITVTAVVGDDGDVTWSEDS